MKSGGIRICGGGTHVVLTVFHVLAHKALIPAGNRKLIP